MAKTIIFTDLDGTLLDGSTYSFEPAQPALNLIREQRVPLIICSSKTRAEIEHYRSLLLNNDPFVSENGGGIFFPDTVADLIKHIGPATVEPVGSYYMVRLGAQYKLLRDGIEALRALGFQVKGFGDMTVEEISVVTGLAMEEAAMARQREFDEPFLFWGTEEAVKDLLAAIHALGLNYTQGRFLHLLGNSDKGRAVSVLLDIFRKRYGEIHSVAIGDSPNDLPMLRNVDTPVVVRKENGTYDPDINLPGLFRADGKGPAGWNAAIIKIFS